jgi:predicted pyridoxine 5'-phosphate oxidase superfamily flavin-nucleotide-binding protein
VATVNADGTPNLSPKGTMAVLDDDHLAFADIRSPGTIRNLRERPAIEVNIVDPIGRMGYRFRGIATVVDGGARLDDLLAFYRNRGTDLPIQRIVVIQVERCEAVVSPAYDQGESEAVIRERWRAHFAALEAAHQV